ncbi:hypothetical protein J6590_095583, partial [Homalodisca vitripennis]
MVDCIVDCNSGIYIIWSDIWMCQIKKRSWNFTRLRSQIALWLEAVRRSAGTDSDSADFKSET